MKLNNIKEYPSKLSKEIQQEIENQIPKSKKIIIHRMYPNINQELSKSQIKNKSEQLLITKITNDILTSNKNNFNRSSVRKNLNKSTLNKNGNLQKSSTLLDIKNKNNNGVVILIKSKSGVNINL